MHVYPVPPVAASVPASLAAAASDEASPPSEAIGLPESGSSPESAEVSAPAPSAGPASAGGGVVVVASAVASVPPPPESTCGIVVGEPSAAPGEEEVDPQAARARKKTPEKSDARLTIMVASVRAVKARTAPVRGPPSGFRAARTLPADARRVASRRWADLLPRKAAESGRGIVSVVRQLDRTRGPRRQGVQTAAAHAEISVAHVVMTLPPAGRLFAQSTNLVSGCATDGQLLTMHP